LYCFDRMDVKSVAWKLTVEKAVQKKKERLERENQSRSSKSVYFGYSFTTNYCYYCYHHCWLSRCSVLCEYFWQ
jgi:hypothetical protein